MLSFLRNFHLEAWSFWIGFLAATLFWWAIRTVRGYMPMIRRYLKERSNAMQQYNQSMVEDRLRRETVRRAQSMHLAAPLFSLDEILIKPRLLPPPPRYGFENLTENQSYLAELLAYMPDWPELPAIFGGQELDIQACLTGQTNIALTGLPGTGKTVALAYLASVVSRREAPETSSGSRFPILLHVNDLDLPILPGSDPAKPIMDAVARTAPVLILPQTPGFLKGLFKSGEILLLLDGLDELIPEDLREAAAYLGSLLKQYPNLRVITTCAVDGLDGLFQLGFHPAPLLAWSNQQTGEFLQRWKDLWVHTILPTVYKRDPAEEIDPVLLDYWLKPNGKPYTPLEFTLRVWAAYAGDARGPREADAVEAYLRRIAPDPKARQALEVLAQHLCLQAKSSIARSEAHKLVGDQDPIPVAAPSPTSVSSVPDAAGAASTPVETPVQAAPVAGESASTIVAVPTEPGNGQLAAEAVKPVAVRRLLPELLNLGILIEHGNEQIRFSHPILAGYLASQALKQTASLTPVFEQPDWIGKQICLRFIGQHINLSNYLADLLPDQDEPLYNHLFRAARYIKDIPSSQTWRGLILRRLAELLQRDDLPGGVRQRALAGLICSGDTSVATLFRQLLVSTSVQVRRLAAWGCGAVRDQKSVDDLIGLLSDPDAVVRIVAVTALAAMEDQKALEGVATALLTGNEDLRRAAAEGLARQGGEGHETLKEASTHEDILVRRAAIFGLLQVNQAWAREYLDKMCVEDGQWMVRSAAQQAVELLAQTKAQSPFASPPPPWEAPWLLAFAARQGVGITPGDPAVELLIQALRSGQEDERLAALEYLKYTPSEGVIGSLMHAIYEDHETVRETALTSLQLLSWTGVKVPPPQQFGLGLVKAGAPLPFA